MARLAALDETKRPLFRGIERADSISLDPHKWLYVPIDSGCLLFRDESPARAAFSFDRPITSRSMNRTGRGFRVLELRTGTVASIPCIKDLVNASLLRSATHRGRNRRGHGDGCIPG